MLKCWSSDSTASQTLVFASNMTYDMDIIYDMIYDLT